MSEKEIDAELIPEGSEQKALFFNREIRKIFHDGEWFFSIVDTVEVLADSPEPASYWAKVKAGDPELRREWTKLKMEASDGKKYATECANTEEILRIIQAVPSKKAERFKRWLARVGYERIQEIQNPEIAIKRAILTYKVKGYSNEWIDARVRTILSRRELTDEWKDRGVKDEHYAILTDEIAHKTFGVRTKAHKQIKQLKDRDSLRDHMTDIELILTMLGEKSTTQIAKKIDAQGFSENKLAATEGGRIAGTARENLEKQLGESVVSERNFLKDSISEDSKSLPLPRGANEAITKIKAE